MLISGANLINLPVMSLQTGVELARTKSVLIDPRNLTVLAYELDGATLDERPSFLRIEDVRELSKMGLIIDSSDEFIGLSDVIKIEQVYEFKFQLVGLDVQDEKKRKLGKVQAFTVDADSFVVQQLNVRRPLFKSLNDTELLIHRSQIVEIDNQKVTVKSGEVSKPVTESIREYVNPFRQQKAQPETTDIAKPDYLEQL